MSEEQRFFISYSRQELYFAEALVRTLENAGVDVWFDLQQLVPGCHWQNEIAAGLEPCDGVIGWYQKTRNTSFICVESRR